MKTVLLDGLVEIKGGGTPDRKTPSYWNGLIPWATVKDFKSDQLSDAQEFITEQGLAKSASFLVPSGSIIIPTRMALGKVAINKIPLAINQDLKALIVKNKEQVDVKYLAEFLKSKASYIESFGKGATVKGITLDVLKNLEIPLPPLPIQRHIARVLDQADQLRKQAQQMETELNQLAQAVFLEMFGDPVTNPKGFEIIALGGCFSALPQIGTITPAEEEGDYPVIRVGEIGNLDVDFVRCKKVSLNKSDLKKYSLSMGDILLARAIGSESHLGKPSLISYLDRETVFDSHVMRLRFDKTKILPEFFYHWLKSRGGRMRFMEQAGRTAVQFNINAKQAANIQIALPPITLQQSFVDFHNKWKELLKENQAQLNVKNTLFHSLVQKAFKGELIPTTMEHAA